MTTTPLPSPESLSRLPTAIYVPGTGRFAIYRGTPEEMVGKMGTEVGADNVSETIGKLMVVIALHRKVVLRLPENVPADRLAAVFVHALLDSKVARPMAQA